MSTGIARLRTGAELLFAPVSLFGSFGFRRIGVILLPLLLALSIRLIGIRHGEPDMVYHPDVAKQTLVARQIARGVFKVRDLYDDDYRLTLYPQGFAVIQGNFERLRSVLDRNADPIRVSSWRWALRMRYLGVALFVVPLGVLLAMLRRAWGDHAALWVGLLLAVEPFHVQFNHYAMSDSPQIGVLLLCWAMSLGMPRERRLPLFSLVAGLAAGVAFGLKYQGLVALLFPCVAWLQSIRARPWSRSLSSALAVALGCLAGILFTCPLLRKDPLYFITFFSEFMSWQAGIIHRQIPLAEKLWTNLYAVVTVSSSTGAIIIAIGAVAGVWHALRRKERAVALGALSSFMFGALILAAVFFFRDIVRANDMIPFFMFAILSYGVWYSASLPTETPSFVRARRMMQCVGWAVFPIFLVISFKDSLAFAREDTRLPAREWCREHLPSNVSVLSERYTLPIGREDIREVTVRSLAEGEKLADADLFCSVDYYITSSLTYQRFYNPGSPYFDAESRATYDRIRATCEKVAEFRDREMLYAQPTITIYRNPNDSAPGESR